MPMFWCSVPARASDAGITLESTPSRRSTIPRQPVSSVSSRVTASKGSSVCSTLPPGRVQLWSPLSWTDRTSRTCSSSMHTAYVASRKLMRVKSPPAVPRRHRACRCRSAAVGAVVEIGENFLVPVDFGPDAHGGVFDDEVVDAGVAGRAAVGLVFDAGEAGSEGGEAVLEVAAQQGGVEVGADGEGQVDGVGADVDFGEGFVAEGGEFATALVGDLVDGAGGQGTVLFGAQGPDEAFVGH